MLKKTIPFSSSIRAVFVAVLLVTNAFYSFSQKTTNTFDVIYDEKTIGNIVATKEVDGTHSIKDLKSNTDAKVLMISVHVESEVTIHAEVEIVVTGKGYRHSNRGPEDILTVVTRMADKKYKVVKNGTQCLIDVPEIKFCVTDLYFSEPKGIVKIFSNTAGDFLSLSPLGNNSYQLTLQDGRKSTFYYSDGILNKVVAQITMGHVTFKRRN